nr:restriction endonuclease subunit S [uncultured Acidovorax sp.]
MLLSNMELLATAPGGVAKLRELILTLAVQGKLVPQDPADEPAGVLLQKIRAEKDRLIAEGKIKRDKPLAEIGEEDKPFGLPVGWEWRRLSELATFENGDRGSNYPSREKFVDDGIAFINAGHLQDERVDLSDMNYITQQNFDLLRSGKVCRNDILYCLRGSLGKFALVDNDLPGAIASSLVIIRVSKPMDHAYLMKYLASPLATRQMRLFDNGTAQPNLGAGDLAKFIVPLPPLAEQSRIVTRVEALMRLCDALEAKGQLEAAQHAQLVSTLLGTLTASTTPEELAAHWQRVAQHFDLLLDRPAAIDALEQTLLQLAVRGLLVPQDPTDEPASALLQKIRTEKDRLIATGQIKQGKPLPPITDEEKPFVLPVGWEWSSLAAVGVISPRNYVADDASASFVEMRSIPVAFGETHLSEERPWRDIKSGFTHFAEGDVGIAKITPCFENGKSTVFQNLSNGVGAGTTELHVVRPLCGLIPQYVLLFLKSPTFLMTGEGVMTGSAGQKRLPRAYFENTPFPLPPLAEQSRIVTRVTALRRLCADLRQRLAEREAVQARLAEALVQEVA